MATELDKVIKRALKIGGCAYFVSLSPDGLKLTQKGRRIGLELKWKDLVNGEAALAAALQASVGKFTTVTPQPAARMKQKRSRYPSAKPRKKKKGTKKAI